MLREFLEEFKVSYAAFGTPLEVTRTSVLRWMTEGRPELERCVQIERLTYGHVKVSDWYLASEIKRLENKATWQAEAAMLAMTPPGAPVTPSQDTRPAPSLVSAVPEPTSPSTSTGETPAA
jgi:hypothetical protein